MHYAILLSHSIPNPAPAVFVLCLFTMGLGAYYMWGSRNKPKGDGKDGEE